MIRAVFFDLDGTLVNSIFDIAQALNTALTELGFPVWPVDAYYRKVGNGARMLCQRSLPPEQEAQTDALLARYHALYLAHCREKTTPYAGICTLLHQLKAQGLLLAVITNKPQSQTEQVITLLPDCFDAVFGQQPPFPVKPDPACFFHVAKTLGLRPEECLYCGDSDVDILFAHRAGAKAIGCAWGFRGKAELTAAGADALAESPAELGRIIGEIRESEKEYL